jgi:hypothetical protein
MRQNYANTISDAIKLSLKFVDSNLQKKVENKRKNRSQKEFEEKEIKLNLKNLRLTQIYP